MTLYDVIQVAIVAGVVLASAGYALGRVAPGARMRLGARLARSPHRVFKALGLRLAGGGSGCGSGCGSCSGCGTPQAGKLIPAKAAQ